MAGARARRRQQRDAATEAPTLGDVEAMIEIITATSQHGPHAMAVSGAGLNELTGTEDYDPDKVYLVTDDGIAELMT